MKTLIANYISSLPDQKSDEFAQLHHLITNWLPNTKLSFHNGLDNNNKVVSNPTIGYGEISISNAKGKTKDIFRIGLCATSTGFSIYFMGIRNKSILANTFNHRIGKAVITSYCVKFNSLNKIDLNALQEMVQTDWTIC